MIELPLTSSSLDSAGPKDMVTPTRSYEWNREAYELPLELISASQAVGKTAVGLWWDLLRGSCVVSDTDSWSTQRRPRSAVSWCLMYLDKPFSLLRPFGSKVVSSLCNSAQVALLWLKPWPVEISEPAHWAGVTWISLPETNMAPGV